MIGGKNIIYIPVRPSRNSDEELDEKLCIRTIIRTKTGITGNKFISTISAFWHYFS